MDSIFLLPVHENYLVYAPLVGKTALINASAAHDLKKAMETKRAPKHHGLVDLFKALGNPAYPVPIPKTGDLSPEFLGIIPTRFCNSRCNYCDFGVMDAPDAPMTLIMAVRCVDWYANLVKSQKGEVLKIHFFGGEPMDAPDLVTAVVHRARLMAKAHDLIPEFGISTNGQYEPQWALFLGDYFDSVVLSFDGPADIQNSHRPLKGGRESFSGAIRTAGIIGNSQADLLLRACVSQKNVDSMAETTQWFCETFAPTKINFEVMQETKRARSHGLFRPDPVTFASGFIKARAVASSYGVPVVYGSDITDPQWTSCPVGKDTVILTPDGRISSCYLMPERWEEKTMDLTLGQMDNGGVVTINPKAVDKIRTLVTDKPRCSRCFCRWSCAGGCHVDNTWPGCSDGFSDFCVQTRIISAATLMDHLGMNDEAGIMADTLSLMNQIALQASDRLSDWKGN